MTRRLDRRRRIARRCAAAASRPAEHACDACRPLRSPARAAAQSAGGVHRHPARRLRGRRIRSRLADHAAGSAGEPAVEVRRAASGYPRILGLAASRPPPRSGSPPPTCCRRSRSPAAMARTRRPSSNIFAASVERVEPHRLPHPAHIQGRPIAASAPRRRGRSAGSRRQLQGHGDHRLSKRLRHPVRVERRCGGTRAPRPLAERTAAQSLALVQAQYKSGAASYVQVLERRANLSNRGRRARQGARAALRGYGGAVSGARRRLVEPQRGAGRHS